MDIIKLKVIEYRIPIEREADGSIKEKVELQTESDSFNITIKNPIAIGEEAKKVAQFNERQLGYLETMPDRDFLLRRIIINNQ